VCWRRICSDLAFRIDRLHQQLMWSRANGWAGLIAGGVAGVVMAGFMMLYMAAQRGSIWTNPNLIAVMWLGPATI
jgi:hypothetical protein